MPVRSELIMGSLGTVELTATENGKLMGAAQELGVCWASRKFEDVRQVQMNGGSTNGIARSSGLQVEGCFPVVLADSLLLNVSTMSQKKNK